MSKKNSFKDFLEDIAEGIRNALGIVGKIKAQDMRAKIESIPKSGSEGIVPTGTKSITANGTHDVTEYASVEVNVESDGTTEPLAGTSVDPDNEYVLIVDNSGNYDEVEVSGVSCITAKEGVTDISIQADEVSVYLNGGSVLVDNLEPANVKSGVTILGITGTLTTEHTFTLPVCGVTSSSDKIQVDEETIIYGHSGSITIDGTIVGTPTITKVAGSYNEVSVSSNVINYHIYSNIAGGIATAEITFTITK